MALPKGLGVWKLSYILCDVSSPDLHNRIAVRTRPFFNSPTGPPGLLLLPFSHCGFSQLPMTRPGTPFAGRSSSPALQNFSFSDASATLPEGL